MSIETADGAKSTNLNDQQPLLSGRLKRNTIAAFVERSKTP